MQPATPKGLRIFWVSTVLFSLILIGGTCSAQSLADAARSNRAQKGASPSKVITSDDLVADSTPEVIQLIPGTSATGQGTLIAPGRGKHSYRVIMLDASRFANGGTIHITITSVPAIPKHRLICTQTVFRSRPRDCPTLSLVHTMFAAMPAQGSTIISPTQR